MLDQIRWLYAFHDWARPRIVAAAVGVDATERLRPGVIPGANEDGSVQAALAHVVGTEVVWFQRWRGEPLDHLPGQADYPTLEAVEAAWTVLERDRRGWLEGLSGDDLEADLVYRSVTRGLVQRYPLWQTLLHLSNHTTHHRGELAAALTGLGSPPDSVDLIDYMRSLSR